jgi:hypothetical protein
MKAKTKPAPRTTAKKAVTRKPTRPAPVTLQIPSAEPAAPTADGWYGAALADGERVIVAVSGGAYTLHRDTSSQDVPAEYVATGYFRGWKTITP